jgi:uncharacterized membrane-anchored protein YhcB (DUF1043 family)
MNEPSSFIMTVVIVVGLIAGYLAVGFVIDRIRKYRNLPRLNETLQQEDEARAARKQEKTEPGFDHPPADEPPPVNDGKNRQ